MREHIIQRITLDGKAEISLVAPGANARCEFVKALRSDGTKEARLWSSGRGVVMRRKRELPSKAAAPKAAAKKPSKK